MPSNDARPPLPAQADLCECCRRPRTDLAVGAPCPDCGVRPPGFPPIPFHPAEPQTLTCSACGYSIENLQPSARCPECGLEIEVTLQGDGLHLADPRYLSRVARGQVWILTTLVLVLLWIVPGFCVPQLLMLAVISLPLAAAMGVWLLCVEDARFPDDAGRRSPARLARIAGCTTVGCELLAILLGGLSAGIWDPSPRGGYEELVPVTEVFALITLAGLIVTLLFASEHVRRTALRMQDRSLQRWARVCGCTWLLCGLLELCCIATSLMDSELAQGFLLLVLPAAFFGAICGAVAVSRLGGAVNAAIARQTAAQLTKSPTSEVLP